MKSSKKSGFTLIELLVVIAIIGLLSSVVLASLNQTRIKGQISKRIQSAKQIQNALELYFSKNGSYPISTGSGCSGTNGSGYCSDSCASYKKTDGDWIPGLIGGGFISALPKDPDYVSGNVCCYMYRSTGSDYKLMFGYSCPATVIGTPTFASYPSLIDPRRDSGPDTSAQDWPGGNAAITSWALYTRGGAGW